MEKHPRSERKRGKSPNFKAAGARALVIWVLVAIGLFIPPAIKAYGSYKLPLSEQFRVSIFVWGANPEAANFWSKENRREDMPVSWTKAIYTPCFREVTGNTFIKPFRLQEPSSPGGYIVTDASIRTALEWREKNTKEVLDRRKDCMARIDVERLRGAISQSVKMYFTDYLRWHLAISVAAVAALIAVRWVMSGLRA